MTTKTTYTLTRALSALKTLDSQIASYFNTNNRILVSVLQGVSERTSFPGLTKADLQARIQSDTDGIENLLERRRLLKSAIVAKNASTTLQIAGHTYTIAEAIELKKLVPMKESVLRSYRTQLAAANKLVADNETKLDARKMELIKAQTTEGASPEDLNKTREFVNAQVERDYRVSLFDPLKLSERIVKLEEEIELIRSELDIKLSELNSTETIEVNLP